jgi:hypothetical protein
MGSWPNMNLSCQICDPTAGRCYGGLPANEESMLDVYNALSS